MVNRNNLYNYNTPKSGNEETAFINIKGRITRKTFLLRCLFALAVYVVSDFLYNNLMYGFFDKRGRIFIFFETLHLYVLPLFIFIFILIQGAKRMHDINKSGWNFLIPFYNLYLVFLSGTKGNNDYGIDHNIAKNITYFDELDISDKNSDNFQNSKTNISESNNDKSDSFSKKKDYSNLIIIMLIVVFIIFFTFLAVTKKSTSTNEITVDTTAIPVDSTKSSNGFDDSKLIESNIADTLSTYNNSSSDSNLEETKTVSFENNSSDTVWLVYAFWNNSKWETIGWYKIEPNKSESFPLPESFYGDSVYWYAEDSNDRRWEGKDGVFCVTHPDAFHYYTIQSNENCKEERNFHKLNLTGTFTNHGLSD